MQNYEIRGDHPKMSIYKEEKTVKSEWELHLPHLQLFKILYIQFSHTVMSDSDKTWSAGEESGKPLLALGTHKQCEKAKRHWKMNSPGQ